MSDSRTSVADGRRDGVPHPPPNSDVRVTRVSVASEV